MQLNVGNLAHFLIDRGLLKAKAVVAGDLTIVDSSRRNRNFKVIRDTGPGLFVKPVCEMQADATLALRRKAACYDIARDDPALGRLMPQASGSDSWHDHRAIAPI